MPKQGTRVEVNSFVKGLITEASPLNFPANASVDEVNFELNRDGTRQRRLGMDLEKDYRIRWTPYFDNDLLFALKTLCNTFVWTNVGGNNTLTILVVQNGNELTFQKIVKDSLPASHVSKELWTITTVFDTKVRYTFANINGKLVVAGGGTHVAVFDYSKGNLLTEYLPIRVRDMWGIEEKDANETDPTRRPTELTIEHEYNLCNQGWGLPRKHFKPPQIEAIWTDPVNAYYNQLNVYPSNSETVYTGLQFQSVSNPNDVPFERIYPTLYEDRIGVTTNTAKGYFILDLHNRGACRMQEMINNSLKHPNSYPALPSGKAYPEDYTTSGPSVVTSYAGRVFYGGFTGEVINGDNRSPVLTDYIFFSNLVRSNADINKCYQSGDPTSKDSSEVVDTDGGFLRVIGAKKITAMLPLNKYLVVIATNGIWVISGGNDYGFTATNFKVEKVSSFGCISPKSIVEVNNALLYWGAEAIYKLGVDKVGSLVVDDFSSETINSYYDDIPAESKEKSVGVYDPVDKKIRWLVNTGLYFGEHTATEIIYDTLLGSYYQHKVEDNLATSLVTLFYTEEYGVKYICILRQTGRNGFSFCDYTDTDFRDWKSVDGTGLDAKAYMITGALTAGDSGIDKQAPYLQLHFRRTETVTDEDGVPENQSSCKMRCQWEWANSPKSKKFTDLVETYRYRMPLFAVPGQAYDNGFDTIITKTKLRGKGKAITLYFETSPYKDCQLLGWNLTINGNAIT